VEGGGCNGVRGRGARGEAPPHIMSSFDYPMACPTIEAEPVFELVSSACAELVDVHWGGSELQAVLPTTAIALRLADADTGHVAVRVVELGKSFRVLVAFDAPQAPMNVTSFADSLWASYAMCVPFVPSFPPPQHRYGNRHPMSLWSRVEAWLAAAETRHFGECMRRNFFPQWADFRPRNGPDDQGYAPRAIYRPPSFITAMQPLIGVDMPPHTWAEKRARERRALKECGGVARPTYHPPGTSHMASYFFSSYHAAVYVIGRLMGNTGEGAINGARPLGGKVDTRLVWTMPTTASLAELILYPHKGSAALYVLPQLPDANASAMWRIEAMPPPALNRRGACSLVAPVTPAARDLVLRGGVAQQLDDFHKELWKANKDASTALETMLAQTRLYGVPMHALERQVADMPLYRLDGVVYTGLRTLRRMRPGLIDKTVPPTEEERRAKKRAAAILIDADTRAKKKVKLDTSDAIRDIVPHVTVTRAIKILDPETDEQWVEVRWRPDGTPYEIPAFIDTKIETGEEKAAMQTGLGRFYTPGPPHISAAPPRSKAPDPPPKKTVTRGLDAFFSPSSVKI
jgi:hypothetical protein